MSGYAGLRDPRARPALTTRVCYMVCWAADAAFPPLRRASRIDPVVASVTSEQ